MFQELMIILSKYFTGFLGHVIVFLLMTIESSLIPFPSELILLPAGAFAYMGNLNIYLVILLGTLGSVFGAIINYAIGYYLGRNFILKYKKIFFVNETHLKKTEIFFEKYGKITTFLGRLVPIVRQYISIPAGLSKMSFKQFLIYTFLGAFIWVLFLSILGYKLGAEFSKIVVNYVNISIIGLVGVLVLVGVFIYFLKKIK